MTTGKLIFIARVHYFLTPIFSTTRDTIPHQPYKYYRYKKSRQAGFKIQD